VDFHPLSTHNSLTDKSRGAKDLHSWAALGYNDESGLRLTRSLSPPLEIPQHSRDFADISEILDNDMTSLQTFGSSSLSPIWQSSSRLPKLYFSEIFTRELFRAWQELVPIESTHSSICTETLMEVISQLRDYIPERYDGEMTADCGQLINFSTDRVFLSFLGYAVYLSTNNLLDGYQINAMLGLLLQSKYFHTIVSFLDSDLPTIEAFSQKLFEAALQSCDKAAIAALLGAGVDLILVGHSFGQGYLTVVKNDEIEIVQILLENGLDVNIPLPYAEPLSILIYASTLRMMQLLVEAGAYVNETGHYRLPNAHLRWNTPLQHASFIGNIDRVRFLLQAGASVNDPALSNGDDGMHRIESGISALMAAVEGNHLELVELLLQSGADVNQWSSFSNCAEYQYLPRPFESHDRFSCKAYLEGHVEGTVLQIAARSGNLELVRLLIGFGAHTDGKNRWRQYDEHLSRSNHWIFRKTALAEAVEMGHYDVAKYLLNAGADVNQQVLSEFGTRVIHAARRHANIHRLLSILGAVEPAPSCIDLQLAVWRGDTERVKALLDMGLKSDVRAIGETDLSGSLTHMAILRGHKALVRFLLGNGMRLDHPSSRTTCLQAATILRDLDFVKILCNIGVNVNATTSATPYPPLQLLRYDDLQADIARDIFRCLLDFGAHANIPAVPSEFMPTPLQNAIPLAGICGYTTVQRLLNVGVDVNSPGAPRTALQMAIDYAKPGDNYTLVRILLEAGADVNQPLLSNGEISGTLVQIAIRSWNKFELQPEQAGYRVGLVELLLKSGADINAPAGGDPYACNRTALQEAADEESISETSTRYDLELIEVLLKHGADVNAPPALNGGRTALQAAASRAYCSFKIVETLLKAGADINAPACPSRGITALQGAAIRGHIKIAKMLIEAGANVNAPGSKEQGITALEGAAEWGRLDMVQLLLNAGADTHLPIEKRYRSAAEFAKKQHHFAIAKLLMSYAES